MKRTAWNVIDHGWTRQKFDDKMSYGQCRGYITTSCFIFFSLLNLFRMWNQVRWIMYRHRQWDTSFHQFFFSYSVKLSDKWTNMEKMRFTAFVPFVAFFFVSRVFIAIESHELYTFNDEVHRAYIGSNGIDCKRVSFKKWDEKKPTIK